VAARDSLIGIEICSRIEAHTLSRYAGMHIFRNVDNHCELDKKGIDFLIQPHLFGLRLEKSCSLR